MNVMLREIDVVTRSWESGIQRKIFVNGTEHMADYKPGSMDITEQEKTFNGFVKFVTWTVVWILVLLVLMAIFLS